MDGVPFLAVDKEENEMVADFSNRFLMMPDFFFLIIWLI